MPGTLTAPKRTFAEFLPSVDDWKAHHEVGSKEIDGSGYRMLGIIFWSGFHRSCIPLLGYIDV